MPKIRLFHQVSGCFLQSDWLRVFWPISQAKDFTQIWNLCRNITNVIFFIMTKFYFKFKKPYFWPVSQTFWAEKFLLKNLALSGTF